MKTEFLNLIGEDGEDSFEVYIAENDIDISYLILSWHMQKNLKLRQF